MAVLVSGAVVVVSALVWRQAVPSAAPAPVRHVHDLGVNPADDTLYAATHQGLYRFGNDGPARLVSNRTHDLMGFTVIGPDRFLASGHPDGKSDEPWSLGLLESSDAGLTWRTQSLDGEVDFHGIDATGATIYGVDAVSGSLLMTTDLRRWQQRPGPGRADLPISPADLAASPADPGSLMAATGQGLRRSADAGLTWTEQPGPSLVLIDWPTAQTVAGVGPDGTVYLSLDAGETWQRRASLPGAPQALHATSTARLYVATDSGVHASVDGGWSFQTLDG